MAIEINDALITQWEPKIQKMLYNTSVIGYSREDLEQELRISIIKAAKGFNEDKGVIFHTYLHTAMINTIRTLISKAQRRLETQSLDAFNEETQMHSEKILKALMDPSDNFEPVVIKDMLDQYTLSHLEHRFLKLRMEGLTMDEISDILDESAYRIRQGIRSTVGDLEYAETFN